MQKKALLRALKTSPQRPHCCHCEHGHSNGSGPLCHGPVRLLNLPVCPITQSDCVSIIVNSLHNGRGGWIVTPNLDHLRRCSTEPHYETSIRTADLRLADGMPLIWASKLRGTPLPERVAGSDLIYSISHALAEEGMSIYLLGGDPGTASAAADGLRSVYPRLVVAGSHCPPPGFERDPQEMQTVRNELIASHPDVVFVALGSPKQEYMIQLLRPFLPKAWWIGIGISFSFVSGDVRRAPRWMQRCGMEWIHRLIQEPRRLAKRYLLHGIPFALRLFAHSALRLKASQPASLQDLSAGLRTVNSLLSEIEPESAVSQP